MWLGQVLRNKTLNVRVFIDRDNEDRQEADIKFEFSWIFSDNLGGEGLGTPHLSPSPPPPSSLNPWVSLLPVFNQNFFNEGITHYYYSTRSMRNFNFLKYVLKFLGLQFKQYSVFSESKLSPSQKKFLDPLCIRLSPHDVCLPLERGSALPPYSPALPWECILIVL